MITQKDLDNASFLKECPDKISEQINNILIMFFNIINSEIISNTNWCWYFDGAEECCVGSYVCFGKTIEYICEFVQPNPVGGVDKALNLEKDIFSIVYKKYIYDLSTNMPEEWLLSPPTKQDLYAYKQSYLDKKNQEQILKKEKKQKAKEKALEDEKFIASLIDSLSDSQIKFLSSLSKVKVSKIQQMAKKKVKELNGK
jgi:hypothetical protein